MTTTLELRARAAQTRRIIETLGDDAAATRLIELAQQIELSLALAEQHDLARTRADARQLDQPARH